MKINLDSINKILTTKKNKKSALAIYIGPESIEIAEMKRAVKDIIVGKTIYKEIQKKSVTSETIKEILNQEDIKETNITTTLPESSVILRRFSMPIIPQEDRANAIRFEAKKHIPFNIEEVISVYHIMKEDPSKDQMDVLFVAAKKQEMDSTKTLLEEAGLNLDKIEPTSISIINTLLITNNLSEKHPPTAIIHFSSNLEAEIIVAEDAIPYLSRGVFLKQENLEDQVMNEIKLTSSYYKREFPEKNINKIILCGLKDKPEWLNILKSTINIPVETAFPLKDIKSLDLPNPQLEIPLGLCASQLGKSKIDLDLLPKNLVQKKYNIVKISMVEIAAALCILGLLYLSHLPSLTRLKKQAANAEKQKLISLELNLDNKATDQINALKTTFETKKQILSAFFKNNFFWSEKLKQITALLPDEIWINGLTIQDPPDTSTPITLVFQLSVYADDPIKQLEIINDFSKKVKNDTLFVSGIGNIQFGPVSKEKIGNYEISNFGITLTVKGAKGTEQIEPLP